MTTETISILAICAVLVWHGLKIVRIERQHEELIELIAALHKRTMHVQKTVYTKKDKQ